ncbi:hypothetical protein RIF29_05437 [Crotalaria pallida]|uniref:Uncharacterized protein n=1 Tax=Crotalaria pallida TaxID=3830 RepID=A0AAN9J2B3_CROPI
MFSDLKSLIGNKNRPTMKKLKKKKQKKTVFQISGLQKEGQTSKAKYKDSGSKKKGELVLFPFSLLLTDSAKHLSLPHFSHLFLSLLLLPSF